MEFKTIRELSADLVKVARRLKTESATLEELKALKARKSAEKAKALKLAENLSQSYSDLEQLRADIQSEKEDIAAADAADDIWLTEVAQSLLETKQRLGL
jgi:hypothetical protein